MSIKWCLTALRDPRTHLHGPYDTRDAATRVAWLLVDPAAKRQAVLDGRMPATLIPTPCDGTCHVPLEYYEISQQDTAPAPRRTAAVPVGAPPLALYKLTEGKLRYMAAQLDIPLPPTAVTRADIITILLKELDL